jgi:hypothetical protein
MGGPMSGPMMASGPLVGGVGPIMGGGSMMGSGPVMNTGFGFGSSGHPGVIPMSGFGAVSIGAFQVTYSGIGFMCKSPLVRCVGDVQCCMLTAEYNASLFSVAVVASVALNTTAAADIAVPAASSAAIVAPSTLMQLLLLQYHL